MGADWALAGRAIVAGLTGVFLVMILLQICTPLVSAVARMIEKPKE